MACAVAETMPDVVEDTEVEADESLAPLWRVVCHDDPVTTMDFVVTVLTRVFRQPVPRAVEVMYRVHFTGAALVGLWPEDVARRRVERAHVIARAAGYPLTFSTAVDG
ncbi:MAG: ATP-dependent Clp protease adaptor ClpS [Planctomycetota bacterium]|nr:ATP-dependent Clp protease adaptor ClpS [Planctomycetota bacterium]